MSKPHCWLLMLVVAASSAYAQDADTIKNQVNSLHSPVEPDSSIFSSADSLSIFNLIDSLLSMDVGENSQLALRLGYNSNVLAAGRTLGIQNFGLSPGVTYYHKTGLYADISSYWSKDFVPSYYLTILSLGYLKDFTKHLSIMAGYDYYQYNLPQGSYIPFQNTLSITPFLEFKPVSFSANYSYYFGDQTAHRIMPGLMVTIEKKNLWKFDRVAVMPSYFVLFGNEIITTIDIRTGRILSSKNVFGVMNYAFTIPLSITVNKWAFSFSYSYNVPKALEGETLTFSRSNYLTGSLTYFIEFKGRQNTL